VSIPDFKATHSAIFDSV